MGVNEGSPTKQNCHVEVDSYSVTCGYTRVVITREGEMWLIRSHGRGFFGARFADGDHQAMMSTALEYAQRLNEIDQKVAAAKRERDDVHVWLQNVHVWLQNHASSDS